VQAKLIRSSTRSNEKSVKNFTLAGNRLGKLNISVMEKVVFFSSMTLYQHCTLRFASFRAYVNNSYPYNASWLCLLLVRKVEAANYFISSASSSSKCRNASEFASSFLYQNVSSSTKVNPFHRFRFHLEAANFLASDFSTLSKLLKN